MKKTNKLDKIENKVADVSIKIFDKSEKHIIITLFFICTIFIAGQLVSLL